MKPTWMDLERALPKGLLDLVGCCSRVDPDHIVMAAHPLSLQGECLIL
jgi:hypothetical protein